MRYRDNFNHKPPGKHLSTLFLESLESRLLLSTPGQWLSVLSTENCYTQNAENEESFATAIAYTAPPFAALESEGYILFLDFDGGQALNRPSDSWLYNHDPIIPAYDLSSYGWGGREVESIEYIVEFVKEDYAAYNVEVTTEEPESGEYNTIFVGGTNDWYHGENSSVLGTASYDPGNESPSNYGFAFTEEMTWLASMVEGDLLHFSELVANLISHEAGHNFGARHIEGIDTMMYGGGLPYHIRPMSFGSGQLWDFEGFQDTQTLLGNNLGYAHGPDDHGDAVISATAIAEAGQMDGLLERRDDVDVFTLVANESRNLGIHIETSVYGNLDSFLQVFDQDGHLLEENDNDGENRDSSVIVYVTENQSYTIYVSSSQQDYSGSYTLNLSLLDTDPPTAPGIPQFNFGYDSGISNTDNITNIASPSIFWGPSESGGDANGIAGYQWRLDGGIWSTLEAKLSVGLLDLTDGEHSHRILRQ